jgi:hypothetical protein
MLAATVLVVLPTTARLRRGLHNLGRIRVTYTQKLSWAGNQDELERRVGGSEAAMAKLDAMLLDEGEVPQLTRAVNAAARAAGCSLLATRPTDARVVHGPAAREGKREGAKPAAETLQWRVTVEVQGEYSAIAALLAKLRDEPWHLQLLRLNLHPSDDDRETLRCEFDLAGYGLRPRADGG